ncbi:MAG: hybrid sensor histidine kinase/response regulator [Hyphomicrobiales bacterium]|nr:MAG: hybrid sensor histidine kinase/response regulator [Hyphomicrobiales bacterium]
MLQGWVVVGAAFVYIGFLFAVASYGDRTGKAPARAGRPAIYALSLAVYCTSWTFFGSVGMAVSSGLDFLTIYIGPILFFTIGFPLLRRIVRLAKAERITSIADFMAARYGKSQPVAAVVTLIALVGTVPYIALQLKAVSTALTTMLTSAPVTDGGMAPVFGDIALVVAFMMAVFTALFGTRHIDATEHQEGLMLAIATESVVKLVAFLAAGIFVTFWLFDGPTDLLAQFNARTDAQPLFDRSLNGGTWIVLSLLSFFAVMMLPRQFHVTITENHNEAELKRARWLFPLYLVLINLFVVPIAAAGLITFGDTVNADAFVLALPMQADAQAITLITFIGGLSAATAMVIVASVALAIMISNDLVIPFILRRTQYEDTTTQNMARLLLNIRRAAIGLTLLLAYIYYRLVGGTAALASIGLLSFAAIAQFAPAFLGGLVWRRATARGAIAGMVGGFLVWTYTLLLPTFVAADLIPRALLDAGPFGIAMLRPQELFGMNIDPFIHGVFWSLAVNVVCYVAFSLSRTPEAIERLQASMFVPSDLTPAPALRLWRTAVTVEDLRSTVARYLGDERAERAFDRYAREGDAPLIGHQTADAHLMRYSEQLLASAIGAASARLVISLLVKQRDPATKGAMKLLDDATAAIQYNRDLLQTALDQVGQGIAVFDRELRLSCWNRQYRQLLGLPPELGHVGTPLSDILMSIAESGEFGAGSRDLAVADRMTRIVKHLAAFQEHLALSGTVLEVRTSPMPDGGIVLTYTDITERVMAEEALARANETLEKRVRERTMELTRLNQELIRAKREADNANLGKTRFLAAAGHDILQPLNAARLYVQSLVDRFSESENRDLVRNIEASLESVEEIIGAVLDISRLDTGALKPEISIFRLDTLLDQVRVDFEPMAKDKGLDLRFVSPHLSVRSDRRLLRRLLQNLVSNAIKYTGSGRILVGCRRQRNKVRIEVHDTGMGIPLSKQKEIFAEFQRLEEGARAARGLGLGLSIVERISRVLHHPVTVVSTPDKGSRFAVELPITTAVPVEAAPVAETPVPASRLEGLLVLCIDNEPKILSGMRTLLEGWGCTVLTANDKSEAALAIQGSERMPDLLFVDYHLDAGTGIEAAVHLRWKFGIDLPGALVTADRSPAVRADAEAKNLTVLQKPVKPAALRAFAAQVKNYRSAAE